MTTSALGKSAQTIPTGRNAHTLELSQSASYALAKQLPNILERGCLVCTCYGDLAIPPGRMAERLVKYLAAEISKGGLQ